MFSVDTCLDKSPVMIAVTGYCGVGKTTFAKSLVELLPHSILIRGDETMISSVLLCEDNFFEFFNMELDKMNYVRSLIKGINGSAKGFRKYLFWVAPYVEDKVNCTIQGETDVSIKYVVVEWGALPLLPTWDKATYRIMIDAPKNIRDEMLCRRPHHADMNDDDYIGCAEAREEGLREILEATKGVDYLVYNAFDQHFAEETTYLSEKISRSFPLYLPI